LGVALVNAGEGPAAAAAYLRAAEVQVTPARALDLRRRAADQLVLSGYIKEGLALVDEVLASIGLRLPKSQFRVLLSLLWGRLRVRLRGLQFRERSEDEIGATELLRIDTCFQLSMGLGMVDTLGGAAFQSRNLLLALRAGVPLRVAGAVGAEAIYVGSMGAKSW